MVLACWDCLAYLLNYYVHKEFMFVTLLLAYKHASKPYVIVMLFFLQNFLCIRFLFLIQQGTLWVLC